MDENMDVSDNDRDDVADTEVLRNRQKTWWHLKVIQNIYFLCTFSLYKQKQGFLLAIILGGDSQWEKISGGGLQCGTLQHDSVVP